jgi:hypothetical protein
MDGLTVTHICGENLTDVRSILVASTHLTSLQFCGNVLKSSGADEEENLVMTSLKCLSIKHTEPFWPITCPNLTHLILGPFSGPTSPSDQSISLPLLTEFVFFASYTSAGILRGSRSHPFTSLFCSNLVARPSVLEDSKSCGLFNWAGHQQKINCRRV